MSDPFDGFPAGEARWFKLPEAFVSELVPLIDDLAEFKVVLFCMWALMQREGRYRYLRHEHFVNDSNLMRGLRATDPTQPVTAVLERALKLAVQQKILLTAEARGETLYFMNTERGREAVESVRAGRFAHLIDDEFEILPPRPNIYHLYESEIGALTPMTADFLRDAEREYTVDWVADAIRVAVENEARSWRYVSTVLERWKKQGRSDHETTGQSAERDGRRFITGEDARFIQS